MFRPPPSKYKQLFYFILAFLVFFQSYKDKIKCLEHLFDQEFKTFLDKFNLIILPGIRNFIFQPLYRQQNISMILLI